MPRKIRAGFHHDLFPPRRPGPGSTSTSARWWPTHARSRSACGPASCRWSKLTATDWERPGSRGASRRSIPGASASRRWTKGWRFARRACSRPILVVSPLTPGDPRAGPGARIPPHHRRPGDAPTLGRPLRRPHSTSRSTPGWRARGSAGTTTRRSPRRARPARHGPRLGGRLHPFPLGRHATPGSAVGAVAPVSDGARGASAPAVAGARRQQRGGLRGREYAADLAPAGHLPLRRRGRSASAAARDRSRRSGRASLAVRRVAAGESVSYGATWRAPAADHGRHARHRLRGRAPARGRSRPAAAPRSGRAARPRGSGRRAGDDGHDHGGGGRRAGRGGRRRDHLRRARLARPAGARPAGTISYELLTALGARVPRRYRVTRRRAPIIVLDGVGIGPRPRHRRVRRRRQRHAGQRGAAGRRARPAEARGARPGPLRRDRGGAGRRPRPRAAHGSCEPVSAGKGQHDRSLGDLRPHR